MERFKIVFFTAAPFILFSIFNGISAPFLMKDPLLLRNILIIFLILSTALVALQIYLKDKHFFPITITLFFIIWGILLFSIPIENHKTTLSDSILLSTIFSKPQIGLYSILFLMSVVPPLLGFGTFTYYFAKRTVPEAFHGSRLFRVVNIYITAFWAILFFLSIWAQFLPHLALQIIVPIILQLGIGAPLTRFLIPYLQGKLAYIEKGVTRDYLKTAYDAISGMPIIMNRKMAQDLHLIIQFYIFGDEIFNGYLNIDGENCTYHEGVNREADLVIKSSAKTWLKISRGEIMGNVAFLNRMYTAEGNLENLIKMQDLFETNNENAEKNIQNTIKSNRGIEKSYTKLIPGSVQRVLAICGSPRAEGVSKTEMVTKAFLEGCNNAGAEIETINLREMNINHCTGCYTCWTKTPGKCVFNDDAAKIQKKVFGADLVVYGFPLYHFGINSLMKKFIERSLPLTQPYLIHDESDGKTHHPLRDEFKRINYSVIIGVCGFPEVEHFNAASANFHSLASSGKDGFNIVSELYRPASEGLTIPFYKKETSRILNLFQKAGEQVVNQGYIDKEIAEGIARVDIEKNKFRNEANMMWDLCIREGKTLPQMQNEFSIINGK